MTRLNGTMTRMLAYSALDVRQLIMLISDTNAALELLQSDSKIQNGDKDIIQRIQDIFGTLIKKDGASDEGMVPAVAKYNGCVVDWVKAMEGAFKNNPHMSETLKEDDTFVEMSKIFHCNGVGHEATDTINIGPELDELYGDLDLEDKEEVVEEADDGAVDDDT